MTLYISHRINTCQQLINTPLDHGVEIDIRSHNNDLYLHHDPFCNGERLIDWLEHYKHKTLILNVKEEGLELALLELMKKFSISDFFFLDQSFPFLLKHMGDCAGRAAVRFSEFESLDTVSNLAGKIKWVWIDCFNDYPLDLDVIKKLNALNFKTCLVSPELQQKNPEKQIPRVAETLRNLQFIPSAICTKRSDIWKLARTNV